MGFFSTIEIGAGIGIHVPHPAAAATRSRSSTRGRRKDDFLMVAAAAADERGRLRLPSNPFPLLRRRTTPPRRRFLISPAAGAASDCDQFSERTSPDEAFVCLFVIHFCFILIRSDLSSWSNWNGMRRWGKKSGDAINWFTNLGGELFILALQELMPSTHITCKHSNWQERQVSHHHHTLELDFDRVQFNFLLTWH